MPIRQSLARIKGRIMNKGKHVEWLYTKVLRRPIVLKSEDGHLFEFGPENSFARHINRKGFTDDRSVLEYVMKAAEPGSICFDIGACFGVVTLCMAEGAGPAGRVHAFEAEKANHRNLSRNVEINGFANVSAHNLGVYSDEKGFDLSVYPKEAYGIHSLKTAGDRGAATQHVDTVTLDGFCAREGIGRIDLMKIDVEGVEPEILKGGMGLLARHAIRKIIFEVSEASLRKYGASIDELAGLLTRHGYAIWDLGVDGSLTGPLTRFPRTNFDNWVALAP